MAKKTSKRSAEPASKKSGASHDTTTSGKKSVPVSPPKAGSAKKMEINPLARHALMAAARRSSAPKAPGGELKHSKEEIDAIRKLAVAMAGPDIGADAVMICNPITEPPAIPLSDLLYDICRWCQTDIYYDRMMPSAPGMMRVCLKCGIMLLEADKKGAN